MAHRSRLAGFIIDCNVDDLGAAAAFWSAALARPAKARDEGSDGKYDALQVRPDEPEVLLQRVDHESRVHLDIETDDIDAEVARLERLGAKKVAFVKRWWVMEAPSGHRFCVVRPQRGDLGDDANLWD